MINFPRSPLTQGFNQHRDPLQFQPKVSMYSVITIHVSVAKGVPARGDDTSLGVVKRPNFERPILEYLFVLTRVTRCNAMEAC